MAGEPISYEGAVIPFAIKAAQAGYSANAFVRALADAGAGMRRAVALKVFAQGRALAAEYRQEPSRPLNAVPTFSESRQWPTRDSSGVLQTVQLTYRERVTDRLVTRFYNVKTAGGITRQEAIDQAVAANSDNADRYQQVLVGAVHTGTAVLVAESAA
jgi:hypothetical protein